MAARWVDEQTPCRPVSDRSIERLKAEEAWRALAKGISKPLAMLRLSGIYGPGRNTFVNLDDGSAKRIVKPGQYFNRIHVADIAGAAMFLAGPEVGRVVQCNGQRACPAAGCGNLRGEADGYRSAAGNSLMKTPKCRPWRGRFMARSSGFPTPKSAGRAMSSSIQTTAPR